jgi:hypothetical protein
MDVGMMTFGNEKILYGAFELGRLPNGDLEVSLVPFRLEQEANKRWGTKIKEELEKENEMGEAAQVKQDGNIPSMVKELTRAVGLLEEAVSRIQVKTKDIQYPVPGNLVESQKDAVPSMSPIAESLRQVCYRMNEARYRIESINDQIEL